MGAEGGTWDSPAPVNGIQTTKSGHLFNSWRALLYPYLKNLQLLADPAAPALYQDPAFAASQDANYLLYGNFGMNHMYLGPQYYNGSGFKPKGVSMTSFSKPAQTVYYVEMYNAGVDTQLEWNGAPDYYWSGMVDAPMCWDTNLAGNEPNQVDGNIACIWNWGKNSGWDDYLGLDVNHGGQTSGVVTRVAKGTNVAWVDGHAKKVSIGALAAGTTFAIGQVADDTHFTSDYQEKYLWGKN